MALCKSQISLKHMRMNNIYGKKEGIEETSQLILAHCLDMAI